MDSFIGLLKSKTFWFNVVVGILAFVNATKGELIPNEVAGGIIVAGNIIIRFLTNKPLSEK